MQYKALLAKQERKKKNYMAQGMATFIEMNERAFQMKIAQSLQKMTAGLGDTEQFTLMYPEYTIAAPLPPSLSPSLSLQPHRVEYMIKPAAFCPIQPFPFVTILIEPVRCFCPLIGREEEEEAMRQFFQ